MNQLAVLNPFNAPVYHEETVGSTMEVSRELARQGEPHGTVIAADFQQQGRGRGLKRLWDAERGAGLLCTVLLRYLRMEEIPEALSLRTGLAVSRAIKDFVPALSGRVLIKWPNDIIIAPPMCNYTTVAAGKAAGILAEADGGNVHLGIGVNVAQTSFPPGLHDKATSICLAAGDIYDSEARFTLLEKILARLHSVILPGADWKSRIEARLYKKGEKVRFAGNAADSGEIVSGTIAGLGQGGELLISVSGAVHSFVVGELLFDD